MYPLFLAHHADGWMRVELGHDEALGLEPQSFDLAGQHSGPSCRERSSRRARNRSGAR